jgi:tRNA A-37 threonylcarbamoyl transferase component Bud32
LETSGVNGGTLELRDLTAGGIHWRVVPEFQDLLFGPDGFRLNEWLRAGLARVVKHGPHRTVYHIVLPQLSFYLKHYRLVGLRSWLRELIRPAKARMEFDRALSVAARRVPTIHPLALGVGRRPGTLGDSFLVTRGLENTQTVSAFVEETHPRLERLSQTRLRQRLAQALGRFVARLHDAGIVHHDLHAANLLLRLEPGDQPSLHLIDLHAVHLKRPLGWRLSRYNLVLLNRWFVLRASRSDRLRFWHAYCRARFGLPERAAGSGPRTIVVGKRRQPIAQPARDLEWRTWKSNLRFWRSRDRRCLESNRYYRRLRSFRVTGWAVRDLSPAALDQLLADPDAPFTRTGARLLKDSRSSTVADLDMPVNGVLRPVIYKRFRVTAWRDPWLALVRRTAAVRSWLFGHGLRERCLNTARPLAVFHRRRGFLAQEGYLLTEKIEAAVDLHEFLAGLRALDPLERQRQLRGQICATARLIGQLHRRQLGQRDLKATNLLIAGGATWLIDLVGVNVYRRLRFERRVQNLARLHASFHDSRELTRTDKLRFLRTYLEWGLRGRQGWKEWWNTIAASTQRKVLRNQRSGRPLA